MMELNCKHLHFNTHIHTPNMFIHFQYMHTTQYLYLHVYIYIYIYTDNTYIYIHIYKQNKNMSRWTVQQEDSFAGVFFEYNNLLC